MNEIQQWLINIQARAPNSPVIIVGTHLDVVKDEFPQSFSDYLQVFLEFCRNLMCGGLNIDRFCVDPVYEQRVVDDIYGQRTWSKRNRVGQSQSTHGTFQACFNFNDAGIDW